MELKIGETYKCGEKEVAIIHIEKGQNERGMMYGDHTIALGVSLDAGGYLLQTRNMVYSNKSQVGMFYLNGDFVSQNPVDLANQLKELKPEGVKEVLLQAIDTLSSLANKM